jgi:CheY-like chemotaxis protein
LIVDIVLIDDNDMHLETTSLLLEKNGFSVKCISDSTKAISFLTDVKPSLVILDIMMPGLDGFTLLKSIKENALLKDTPVVILSGKPFIPEQRKALALGAEMYLTKPIRGQLLIEKIQPYLQAKNDNIKVLGS